MQHSDSTVYTAAILCDEADHAHMVNCQNKKMQINGLGDKTIHIILPTLL